MVLCGTLQNCGDLARRQSVRMRGDQLAEGLQPGRLRQRGKGGLRFLCVHMSRHIDKLRQADDGGKVFLVVMAGLVPAIPLRKAMRP